MRPLPADAREGGFRQTVKLLREAATPEVYLRAFKSLKQSSRPATATGLASHYGAGASPQLAALIGVGNAIWYAIESFWDNTVSNAELILKDSPTQKTGMTVPEASPRAMGEPKPGPRHLAAEDPSGVQ